MYYVYTYVSAFYEDAVENSALHIVCILKIKQCVININTYYLLKLKFIKSLLFIQWLA